MADEQQTITEAEWKEALEQMARAGKRDGEQAGEWIADANTKTEALEITLKQFHDGDPAAPEYPNPFSAEWADNSTARDVIERHTDLDRDSLTPEDEDELADAYESAFHEGWYESAEQVLRNLLDDGKHCPRCGNRLTIDPNCGLYMGCPCDQ